MILSWKTGGILLGIVFFAAVLLVKPIGVSTQFVIFDGILWDSLQSDVVVTSETTESGYASSILMFGGLLAGFVEPGNLSVKTAYLGVFVGGLLLGAGFAISGFCPGTGLTAADTGRKDAMFFVLGGLVGAALYMGSYAWVDSTGLLASIAGGKTTLGTVSGTDYPAILGSVPGEWVGIVLGIVFVAVAALLPNRLVGRSDRHVGHGSPGARHRVS